MLFGGCFEDGFERGWFVDGKFSEDFAVEADLLVFESLDKRAVAYTVCTCCCIDASIPQLAEGALALAAVAVGVFERLHERLTATLNTYTV